VWPISPYGVSKHCLEHYLYCYHHNFGMDYLGLRFSNVYGPRDDVKSGRLIPNFVAAMRKAKKPFITGDGKQGRDFIYVGDVARAVVLGLEKKTKSRFLNIGTQELVSINEIFRITQGLLGIKMKPRYVAPRPGEVRQIYLKAEKARKELGWKAEVRIEQGLREYVRSVEHS
jgi:UDP-glucose 4-epimerase